MKSKSIVKLLEIHDELVGKESGQTDLDRIINIIQVLVEKVEELENHTHTIS